MSCEEPCDGCPRRSEHHLCDECCHAEPDAISAENARLREALDELLTVSRSVWAAIVEHKGPPVLEGKTEVALAFIAAANKATTALETE